MNWPLPCLWVDEPLAESEIKSNSLGVNGMQSTKAVQECEVAVRIEMHRFVVGSDRVSFQRFYPYGMNLESISGFEKRRKALIFSPECCRRPSSIPIEKMLFSPRATNLVSTMGR